MGERVVVLPVALAPRGIQDVIAARIAQVLDGYDAASDDAYDDGELARAGICYAGLGVYPDWPPSSRLFLDAWPFARADYKPKTQRENLVRAAALLLAELDRLDRAAQREAARG